MSVLLSPSWIQTKVIVHKCAAWQVYQSVAGRECPSGKMLAERETAWHLRSVAQRQQQQLGRPRLTQDRAATAAQALSALGRRHVKQCARAGAPDAVRNRISRRRQIEFKDEGEPSAVPAPERAGTDSADCTEAPPACTRTCDGSSCTSSPSHSFLKLPNPQFCTFKCRLTRAPNYRDHQGFPIAIYGSSKLNRAMPICFSITTLKPSACSKLCLRWTISGAETECSWHVWEEARVALRHMACIW